MITKNTTLIRIYTTTVRRPDEDGRVSINACTI
jgi:hypothetical protein